MSYIPLVSTTVSFLHNCVSMSLAGEEEKRVEELEKQVAKMMAF